MTDIGLDLTGFNLIQMHKLRVMALRELETGLKDSKQFRENNCERVK